MTALFLGADRAGAFELQAHHLVTHGVIVGMTGTMTLCSTLSSV